MWIRLQPDPDDRGYPARVVIGLFVVVALLYFVPEIEPVQHYVLYLGALATVFALMWAVWTHQRGLNAARRDDDKNNPGPALAASAAEWPARTSTSDQASESIPDAEDQTSASAGTSPTPRAADLIATVEEVEHHPDDASPAGQGRPTLIIRLRIEAGLLHRSLLADGQPVEPPLRLAPIPDLQRYAAQALPDAEYRDALGRKLYGLLLVDPEPASDSGDDRFPDLAEAAWHLPRSSPATKIGLSVLLRASGPAAEVHWLLGLPWHLARPPSGDTAEPLLADHGWTFEATPSNVRAKDPAVLLPDPSLLVLCDEHIDGGARHAAAFQHQKDDGELRGELSVCTHMIDLQAKVRTQPPPEILYAYTPDTLDLDRLAEQLGGAVPLILLNLIGVELPLPPPRLVQGRVLILATWAPSEADQARKAGRAWLRAVLRDADGLGPQRLAIRHLGKRVRLYSGCAGLETRISKLHGDAFQRSLIRLLLDRHTARLRFSEAVSQAFADDKAVLALVAAGTPSNHPELFPEQVWHHYRFLRGEAVGRHRLRRFRLSTGPEPDAAELFCKLAKALNRIDCDAWESGIDQLFTDAVPEEQLILGLQWHLRPTAGDAGAESLRDWLDAWQALSLELTRYRRARLLIVNMLIVTTDEPVAATEQSPTAATWCEEANTRWRRSRSGGAEADPRSKHHEYLPLPPLSVVPASDLEDFFHRHYKLGARHGLDAYEVAMRVHARHEGAFAPTVALVEQLHDNDFEDLPSVAPEEPR